MENVQGLESCSVRTNVRTKGHNVAVVALVRAILCISDHHLMNQEMFQEDGVEKSGTSRLDWSFSTTDKMSLKTMIEIIAKACYEVTKIERDKV